jgi:uncharacterized protein
MGRSMAIMFGAVLLLLPMASFAQAAHEASSPSTSAQTAQTIPPEDQATKEQLDKLFEAMRIRDQMQSIRRIIPTTVEAQLKEQMQAIVAQNPSGTKPTTEQQEQLDRLMHKYMEKAVNLYPIDEMLADMTGLYQRYLTREDVDAMLAFYSSTAGRHLLDAQPKIAREYMPLVMSRMTERSKALTAEMMKDMAELKQATAPAAEPAKK